MKNINVVLHEPEIPQNTGNISRTCAAAGCALHLIKPLGFTVTDSRLKRAGLDYWDALDLTYYENWDEFQAKHTGKSIYYFSTKAPRCYTEARFEEEVYLVFGKETAGLPVPLLRENYDRCLRIPMLEGTRSLNLSNSAAIAVYEALRQRGFEGLKGSGDLKNVKCQV